MAAGAGIMIASAIALIFGTAGALLLPTFAAGGVLAQFAWRMAMSGEAAGDEPRRRRER